MGKYQYDNSVTVWRRSAPEDDWWIDQGWKGQVSAHDYVSGLSSLGDEFKIEAVYTPKIVRTAEDIVQEMKEWYARGDDPDKYALPVDVDRFNEILRGEF